MCYGMNCRFEDWRGECDAMVSIKRDEIEYFANKLHMTICELANYLDYLEATPLDKHYPILMEFKKMMARKSKHDIWAELYKKEHDK